MQDNQQPTDPMIAAIRRHTDKLIAEGPEACRKFLRVAGILEDAAAPPFSEGKEEEVPEEIVQWIEAQLNEHGILAGSNIFKKGAIAMYHKMQEEIDCARSESLGYKQVYKMALDERDTVESTNASLTTQLSEARKEAAAYRKEMEYQAEWLPDGPMLRRRINHVLVQFSQSKKK